MRTSNAILFTDLITLLVTFFVALLPQTSSSASGSVPSGALNQATNNQCGGTPSAKTLDSGVGGMTRVYEFELNRLRVLDVERVVREVQKQAAAHKCPGDRVKVVFSGVSKTDSLAFNLFSLLTAAAHGDYEVMAEIRSSNEQKEVSGTHQKEGNDRVKLYIERYGN